MKYIYVDEETHQYIKLQSVKEEQTMGEYLKEELGLTEKEEELTQKEKDINAIFKVNEEDKD